MYLTLYKSLDAGGLKYICKVFFSETRPYIILDGVVSHERRGI